MLLPLLLLAAPCVSAPAHKLRVERLRPDGALVLERHGIVRLQGVQAPKEPLPAALRRRLAALVGGRFEVSLDDGGPGELDAVTLRPSPGEPSVNEALLREGLAFFHSRSKELRGGKTLAAAAEEAKRAGRGVWQDVTRVRGVPPVQRGAVLGLYYKEERFDYHEQLRRVKAVGAEWVTLLFTAFVAKVDANGIDRSSRRTVTDLRLKETIAHARKLGLRVALLPIVLIRDAEDEDDWRGTLRPSDPGRFWRSYDTFLCHYLDIARDGGVELFHVGSEFCSLETHHEAWRRVILNARGRFGGWLSYSVNWDHYDVPRFWPLLDQVGLTAYFELTEDAEASLDELRAGWRRVRAELAKLSKDLGRPVVLTELGYPSQNGANTAPWNYFLAPKDIDLAEQADCFRAFAEVMGDAPFLQGVYFFDFFEKGGREDSTYAIWGKPAQGVVSEFLEGWRR